MTKKAKERKDTPVFSGVLNYFPDAMREVAKVSKAGNDQHNPGQELFWDRSKSGDEKDALTRHLLDAGTIDDDGMRHSAKVAWRALAMLQKEIENDLRDEEEQRLLDEMDDDLDIMYPERLPYNLNNLDGTYTDGWSGELRYIPQNRWDELHPREKREIKKQRWVRGTTELRNDDFSSKLSDYPESNGSYNYNKSQ